MDAASPLALVLIGSFAVDRVVSGSLFLLSLPKRWQRVFPDPELIKDPTKKALAAKKRKLTYFLFAALLSIPVVLYGNIRLFPLLGISPSEGMPRAQQVLDTLLTSLIFVGGADRIAELLKKHGGAPVEKPGSGAIEVVGSITIDEGQKGPAPMKCPSCSAELEPASTYCGHCGTHVAAAVKGP